MSSLQLDLFPTASAPWAAGPSPVAGTPDDVPFAGASAPVPPAGIPARIPAAGLDWVATVSGRAVRCRLRRSARARRMRLVVGASTALEVVLPRRFPLRDLPLALEEDARWILRTIERRRTRPALPRQRVEDGAEISFLGVPHVLRLIPFAGDHGPGAVWSRGREIMVRPAPLAPGVPTDLLRAWLFAAARREIPRRVWSLNAEPGFDFQVGRIGVRDQRTKWGACSARGNLSFNWRLVIAPLDVLDYVIVHELCHVRELNHSRRFWMLLESLRPGYRHERGWLREHGDALDFEGGSTPASRRSGRDRGGERERSPREIAAVRLAWRHRRQ